MRRTIVLCMALVSVTLTLTRCGEDSVTAPETETKGGDDGLLRVGILTCGPFSHVADIWGPILNATEERTRMTGMRMTHVWDIVPKDAESFARRYGVEVVADFDDMVGKVDGVILSDFDAVPAYERLARPYLEAGVPIFINRPFAYSLAEARSMIDLAAAHGTPIMSGSSFEYVKEVEIIRSRLAGLGPITGFVADNSMSDYPSHGIHGLYFVYACLGGGVSRVSYLTQDWRAPNGVVVLEYAARKGGKPFYGSVQEIAGAGPNAWIKVYGKGFTEQWIWWEATQRDRDTFLWLPMLHRMQEMFATGTMPEPYENIYEKTQIFLAGFKSHVEYGGAPVALTEIGDWRAPVLNPGRYQAFSE